MSESAEKTRKKVLIVDNTRDAPATVSRGLGADFRRYLVNAGADFIEVRRAPEQDLPSRLDSYTHLILSGGKTSAMEDGPWVDDLMTLIKKAADQNLPTLGVCYGHQLISRALGTGKELPVRKSELSEIGWVEIEQIKPNPIFEGIEKKFHCYQSHFDEVHRLPKSAVCTAKSERCAIQAFYIEGKPIFGIQFHPEKNLTESLSSIAVHKKRGQKDFQNEKRAKILYSEELANKMFGNFLKIK